MAAGSVLVRLFEHNHWANRRIIDYCATLTDDQLLTAAPGTYGTIRDTLVHLLAAEQRYLLRLTGDEPAPTMLLRESSGFPGLDTLRAAADWSGPRFVTMAHETAVDRILRGTYHGEPFEMPVSTLLIQAINHATEHRAQVAAGITVAGLQPPEIDGWAFDTETRRGDT